MRRFLIFLLCIVALNPARAQDAARPQPPANLTILADEAMLMPLAQLARSYATHAKTPLTVVVKNADEAEQQILQGLEAHVIITANRELLGRLTEQGLTDVSSRRSIARTQLALVSAFPLSEEAALAKRISFASVLAATSPMPVYTDAETSIAGEHAAKLTSGAPFSEGLATRLTHLPNHVELMATLRDEPSLGLMLAVDSVAEPDMKVISLLPDEVSAPVDFEAVVLGSESMGAANTFVNYLNSREARAIFNRFGYQTR